MKCILLVLVFAIGLAIAANIKRTNANTKIEINVGPETDNSEFYWELADPELGCGRRCFVKWWIVCGCIRGQNDDSSQLEQREYQLPYEKKETDSCDPLGCNMFCQKNHLKKGICRDNGCECDFRMTL